jgi:hypothetical protein
MYTYYCQPHDQLEMKGAVAVGSDVPTTDEPIADEPETFLGVPLPSTTLQWGIATVATVGATALASAGAWLWWRGTGVDPDDYDDLPPSSGTNGNPGPSSGVDGDGGPLPAGGERLDRYLRTAAERREQAETALTDGDHRRAREALDRAELALDRAADVDAEHDLDAGDRVAAEREVVATLRDRCEGR